MDRFIWWRVVAEAIVDAEMKEAANNMKVGLVAGVGSAFPNVDDIDDEDHVISLERNKPV